MFVLLMSGVILSPMGAYAMDDEGGAPSASISRSYRLPVTVLPSGEVELPSGAKLPKAATAADVLKKMTLEDKVLGQERKPLQPGNTYIEIYNNGQFNSVKYGGLYPGFIPLGSVLEKIEGPTQQPGAFSPYVAGSSSVPSVAPALRPELEEAD